MSKDIIDVQVGKLGFTNALIDEVKKHLKDQKDVKLKFLHSFIADKDRKQVSQEIQEKLKKKGKLIGNTLLIRGNHG